MLGLQSPGRIGCGADADVSDAARRGARRRVVWLAMPMLNSQCDGGIILEWEHVYDGIAVVNH